MRFEKAPDIQKRVISIVKKSDLKYIRPEKLICFRSFNSKSRSKARIWSFPRIWQMALDVEPHYVIEVLSEKFDHLNHNDQTKILIHELLHIPTTFSGALRPHKGKNKMFIDQHTIEGIFHKLKGD